MGTFFMFRAAVVHVEKPSVQLTRGANVGYLHDTRIRKTQAMLLPAFHVATRVQTQLQVTLTTDTSNVSLSYVALLITLTRF